MKKALLLSLTLLLLAAGLRAAPANVNFASERGLPFRLIFDGRPLSRGTTQIHLDRLAPGYHWAEFLLPTPYGRPYSFRTRVFLDPGLETSFVLITRSGYPPQLRKVAAVALRCGPGYGGYQHGGREDEYEQDYGYRDEDRDLPADGYGGPPAGGSGPYGDPYGGADRNRVLRPQDVDQLAETLKRTSFDSNRLSIAKQALEQSYIQANDLKLLLASFDFETSRVELAKYAYPHVADRQNFYRLYDAFDFQSSVQEVQRAVGGGRN
ncbi:protein of unknown function [Hymenobacter daecheongensis DSM 21074]|uniref:DUF4476 domain-containing protein n=1 Tax=Hymenobacter daecheongensis DSM 21074 TaxID=1121955 RepID=A0A1M6B303_9BACT|nr:DUF4476 domain-containing protein [Hymenobacter daecheongensis]SHI43132.1 protein of unknown function [Hymenobacter daecheongensis DSM 21074]